MHDFVTTYADLLRGYDVLLAHVLRDQKQILLAVTGGNLAEIQQSLTNAQANTMRMEQMEARRIALQKENGIGEDGIRQVVSSLPAETRPPLLLICDSIEATTRELHFTVDKTRGMAQCNLVELDPSLLEELLAQNTSPQQENPYQKMRRNKPPQSTIQTKI